MLGHGDFWNEMICRRSKMEGQILLCCFSQFICEPLNRVTRQLQTKNRNHISLNAGITISIVNRNNQSYAYTWMAGERRFYFARFDAIAASFDLPVVPAQVEKLSVRTD